MRIEFWGAARTVTGSRFLIDGTHSRILVDCGMFQGAKAIRKRNWERFPAEPESIDAVILTHAHIDHSGYLPALVRDGFRGPIYCTPATAQLLELLLADSANLQEEEARYANKKMSSKHRPALPLFTEVDAKAALDLIEVRRFGEQFKVSSGFEASFSHAGHILGAASVLLVEGKKSLLVSGDLGKDSDLVMRQPSDPPAADYVLIESTYGDRQQPQRDPFAEIEQIVNTTVARGGTVLFPAFAVGRSQVIMHILAELREQQRIPNVPIYLNSPMACDVTDIYLQFASEHRLSNEQAARIWSGVEFVRSVEDSKELTTKTGPMIVISASGMATGGRVLHHLTHLLPHAQNTVVFAGHQVEGSRGFLLINGARTIRIYGQDVDVFANIVHVEDLSAHADKGELVAWAKQIKHPPTKAFVVHGDEQASLSLGDALASTLGWSVEVPTHGQAVQL